MNDKQAQLAADDAAIEATELRATIRRQAEEIEQLEAIVSELHKQLNLNAWNTKRVTEQLEAAAESAEYWRGRCLGAEMQEHESKWWEG